MKKNAFTMMEIIFVIVILGILAMVAIPRFAATRNDAKVSLMAQNIETGAMEIATYAASKGDTDKNFLVMSNAIKKLQESGNAVLSDDKAEFSIDGAKCIEMEVQRSATNNDLVVSFVTSTNEMCTTLQSLIDNSKYPMRLRGNTVVY